ncbi:serine hydrolase domain-containing protein [Andreprevotia chitinilytica]|uniref:serine hydrolase domain-containing protein n=1 Tax=Andreprevotia chitinilytica TaxID=396808 RepID=UPI00054DF285|nr:serine hydrolase [Andreprevotia chitinilytica]
MPFQHRGIAHVTLIFAMSLLMNCTWAAWERQTPADAGIDAAQLAALDKEIAGGQFPVDALLIARNGKLVTEKYLNGTAANQRLPIYSCTKSITGALVGIAIADHKISGTDATLGSLLPNLKLPADKSAIKLENLLSLTAGFKWALGSDDRDMYQQQDWLNYVVNKPLVTEPGTRFVYNSGVSHLLAAVVQQASKQDLLTYANTKLFGPLGISDVNWSSDPKGIRAGGFGLELRLPDLLKIGQLYLDQGRWQDKQLIPESWVATSTTKHIYSDHDDMNYGYQWYIDPKGRYFAAFGLGSEGHRMLAVVPDKKLVVLLLGHFSGPSQARDILEDYLIPAAQ